MEEHDKIPSKRKDDQPMSGQNATDNNTQLQNIVHVSEGRPEEKDNNNRSPMDEGYWDGLGEHVRLNTKKKETGGSEVV